MNILHGTNWGEKMHRWEHNAVTTTEKMIHNEAFWAALIVSLILITMIILAIVTQNQGPTRDIYPTPFSPYPYY